MSKQNSKNIISLTLINAAITASSVISVCVIGHLFGATRIMDVWFAASTVQGILMKLLQTGQLSEIFLPEYHKIKSEFGSEKARACYSVVVNWIALITISITLLLLCFSGILSTIIAPGLNESEQHQVKLLVIGLLPLLPFQVIAGMQQMLGNAEKWYGKFEIPVLYGSLFGTVSLFIFYDLLGVYVLVLSLWLSQIISFCGRQWQFRKASFRHSWILTEPGFSPLKTFGQLTHSAGYIGATQLYLFQFKAALTFLPPGTMAIFGYAETIYLRTSSLFLRPVSVVFFTNIAEAVASGSSSLKTLILKALDDYLTAYYVLIALVAPSSVWFLSALWGGPKYPWASIEQTGFLLTVFFLAQLCEAYAMVFRKLNIGLGAISRQYAGNTCVQLLLALTAPLLVKEYGIWGASAVIILNTFLFAISNVIVTFTLRPELVVFFPGKTFIRWLVAALPLVWLFHQMGNIIQNHLSWGTFGSFASRLQFLALGSMVGALSLVAIIALGKPSSFRFLFDLLGRKFKKI